MNNKTHADVYFYQVNRLMYKVNEKNLKLALNYAF